MRIYLTLFSLAALSLGIALFTVVLLTDRGMQFSDYKTALTTLLSLTTLISNAAMSFYFAKAAQAETPGKGAPQARQAIDDAGQSQREN